MSTNLARWIGDPQSNELRLIYQLEALSWTADQLVLIGESFFNEATDWQYYTHDLVGQPGQYHASRRRSHS